MFNPSQQSGFSYRGGAWLRIVNNPGPFRLYRRDLRTEVDTLVYEETDEAFVLLVRRTRSGRFVLLIASSHTTSEVWYVSAKAPEEALQSIAAREHRHRYYVDHRGDSFFIRTNDVGRNFRVVTAPVEATGRERWRELIPHSSTRIIEDLHVFDGFCILWGREDGLPGLSVLRLPWTGSLKQIPMPEKVYDIAEEANPEPDQRAYRFRYESLTTPSTIYEYDLTSHQLRQLKRSDVHGYDSDQYHAERVFATAGDGVRIPISLVRRRDALLDGTTPMLLAGYGSYGLSCTLGFDPARVSLLERGVAFAIAHVRGGGELGEGWHDAGRLDRKFNSFTDFIAAGEWLILAGYTSADRLVIEGASAGGLLMAGVVNMRPDLFKALVMHAPFVDVLTNMCDPQLPLTSLEYEEWGDPGRPEELAWILQYCPYTNLKAQAYPAMLIRTGRNDTYVLFWGVARYVAALRRVKTDSNPLLLRTDMTSGHMGPSGRYDRIRERALDLTFMLTQVGISE